MSGQLLVFEKCRKIYGKKRLLEILTKEEKTLKQKVRKRTKNENRIYRNGSQSGKPAGKIISLTETGKQYARELVLPLFQSEEEAAAQFTEQEMTEVIRMQEKFADALAKSMEEKVSIVQNLSAS